MSKLSDVSFIKASAGSGKTYSITGKIADEIRGNKYTADQVLATTFTVKAANELESRIRARLLEDDNLVGEASKVRDALIGTVNSVCGQLLSEQAIAAGESPSMAVLPDESAAMIFNQAISRTLEANSERMNELAGKIFVSDWVEVVRDIVDRARMNGIKPEQLQQSQEYSIESAKKIYVGGKSITPTTYKQIVDKHILPVKAIGEKTYEIAKAEGCSKAVWEWCNGLLSGDYTSWKVLKCVRLPDWPKEKSKKALAYAAPVRPLYDELARIDILESKELQHDVIGYVKAVFDVAKVAMEEYEKYKKEYGLVDFVDQEVKVLTQLDENEDFRTALKSRVKAIYVDEFQDTNPVQLAVYLKLSEVVDGKTTWVGDPKQAIYRFRGADPVFVSKVMSEVRIEDTLPYSWRSKQNLVDFSNEVFAKVFPGLEAEGGVRLGIDPEEAQKPERQGGDIGVWQIESANVGEYASVLANRIALLFKNDPKRLYGDVAVLLRQNSECDKLAAELQKRGVPTSIGGKKLREDLIANLAMCAYRCEYSLGDTVALAVMKAYRPDVTVKTIEDPNELEAYSPIELFEKAVADWKIGDYVRGSESSERGLATIEALRQLCRDYEGNCKVRGVQATHSGFIKLFMDTRAKGASAAGGDCVQIHTYHGAKGLEWKTVILGSLNEEAEGSPFGIKSDQIGDVLASNPLDGRFVRYIPSAFGDSRAQECGAYKGNAGFEAMATVEKQAEMEEMRRLMYVGITRAKEEVIFAPQLKLNYTRTEPRMLNSKTIQTKWMGLLTDKIDFKSLMESSGGTWNIGGRDFAVDVEDVEASEDVSVGARQGFADKAVTCPSFEKRKAAPSSLEGGDSSGVRGVESDVGGVMELEETVFSAELGECFHSYMAVAVPGVDDPELAKGLIERWGVKDVLAPGELVKAGARLREWINMHFKAKAIHTEVPMSFNHEDGRVSEGFIDMLVEAEDGSFAIIDHKVINDENAAKCVTTYAPQQEVYRNAVIKIGNAVSAVYLHLPAQGKMVEIKY